MAVILHAKNSSFEHQVIVLTLGVLPMFDGRKIKFVIFQTSNTDTEREEWMFLLQNHVIFYQSGLKISMFYQ